MDILSRAAWGSRTRSRLIIGVLFSLLLTYLAYRQLNPASLRERIGAIPLYPVLLCIGGQICLQLLHMVRWGILIRKLDTVPWLKVFSINVISNAALYLLPMRLGELFRPTISAAQTKLKISQTSTTSVIERTVDGLMIGSLALVSVFSRLEGPGSNEFVRPSILLSIIIFFLLASLFIVVRKREWPLKIILYFLRPFPPRISVSVVQFVEQFTKATGDLLKTKTLLPYIGLSLGIWLIDASSIYVLFSILDGTFPFQATLVALSFVVLGSLLPSGPGQIGIFEYSISLGLLSYGIRMEDGILIATIYHSIVIGTIIILGLTGLLVNRKILQQPNHEP